MNRILAASGLVAAGAIAGVAITTTLQSTAGVTLTSPIDDDRSHGTVAGDELRITWSKTGQTQVTGTVTGLDSEGAYIPETRTRIRVGVPAGEGDPLFDVTGYAREQGVSPSCSGTRSGVLSVTDDIRQKLENFADGCLNE